MQCSDCLLLRSAAGLSVRTCFHLLVLLQSLCQALHAAGQLISCCALQVLTMEYVPGTKINQAAELDALGIDRALLAQRAVECYLQQLLTFGFFHAGRLPLFHTACELHADWPGCCPQTAEESPTVMQKGTNTQPVLRGLPSALTQLARAGRDLHGASQP